MQDEDDIDTIGPLEESIRLAKAIIAVIDKDLKLPQRCKDAIDSAYNEMMLAMIDEQDPAWPYGRGEKAVRLAIKELEGLPKSEKKQDALTIIGYLAELYDEIRGSRLQ